MSTGRILCIAGLSALGFVAGVAVTLVLRPAPPTPVPCAEMPAADTPLPVAAAPTPRAHPGPLPSPPSPGDSKAGCADVAFENTILRGQLAQYGALPMDWDPQVPPTWRQPAVNDALAAFVADRNGLELAQVDCIEMPCLAVVEVAAHLPNSTSVLDGLDTYLPEGGSLGPMLSCTGTGCTAVVAIHPPSIADDPLVQSRTEVRASALLDAGRATPR